MTFIKELRSKLKEEEFERYANIIKYEAFVLQLEYFNVYNMLHRVAIAGWFSGKFPTKNVAAESVLNCDIYRGILMMVF